MPVLVGDGDHAQLAHLAGAGDLAGPGLRVSVAARPTGRSPARDLRWARLVHRLGAQRDRDADGRRAWVPRPRSERPRAPPPRSPPRRLPCSVLDEDGQPSQLPRRRSLTAPSSSSIPRSSTSPPCWAKNGRTETRADSTRLSSDVGVQPLDQKEAGEEIVGDEGVDERRIVLSDQLHGAGEPGAVELGDQAKHLLGQIDGAGIGRCVQLGQSLLDPIAGCPEVLWLRHLSPVLSSSCRRHWRPGSGSASS